MQQTKKKNDLLNNSIRFLLENSLFLIGGAALALIWANVDLESYEHLVHGGFHFLVNDILMAFFFLLAGKEIRESMLPGGALSSVKTAALPIIATFGGMAGPALLFVIGAQIFEPEATRGWAVPMATDIAFSYLVARMVFPRIGGKAHPAIVFLLLLAIADDAGGLIVLAVVYPQEVHNLLPFLKGLPTMLTFSAGLVSSLVLARIFWKVFKITSFWPYLLIPGAISWFAFHEGGIHPALALVPLAWCMPHEHTDLGIWEKGESLGRDTLNRMEHWWKNPVEIILGLFGFANAGVAFTAVGAGTALVFFGLLIGKPLGIVLCTKAGELAGLKLPKGMTTRDLIVVGFAAGIGFTVALFVSVVAFKDHPLLDSVKMGALFSFVVAPITLVVARVLRTKDRAREQAGE